MIIIREAQKGTASYETTTASEIIQKTEKAICLSGKRNIWLPKKAVELGKTVSFKPLKTIDELTIKEWFDSTYAREKEPFLLTEQNESNSNLEQRLW